MVTKDEVVQLFEKHDLSNKLKIRSEIFVAQSTDLEDTQDITGEPSKVQPHLEIWGYTSIDPDQLILDLLLPIRQDRRGEGLERVVTNHCLYTLEQYGRPELGGFKEYVNIFAPLLTLQQVNGVIIGLSRNPTQLRDADISFAIYQRYPPLSQTYQLTATRKANEPTYEQTMRKALEYLELHKRGSHRVLVAYLTGAGLGNEKEIESSIDIMRKSGVIKTVGNRRFPHYTKGR